MESLFASFEAKSPDATRSSHVPDLCPFMVVPFFLFAGIAHGVPQQSPDAAGGSSARQACCFFDQPCQNLLPDDCIAAGGSPLPGVCEATTCLGACCTPSGCVMTLFIECGLPKGYFQGYGIQCDSGVCELPRACCMSDGTCVDLELFQCLAAGGIPRGAGTVCSTQTCFPYGACCLPDGSCLVDVNEFVCDRAGGKFQGPGTSCFVVNCPQPPQFCCLRNGCCVEVTPTVCAILGGFTSGQAPCAIVGCSIDPCPADMSPSPAGNGVVDIDDLVLVITSWGACDTPCPETDGCYGDIVNCDCTVNIDDLVTVITSWGACRQ
jgi:hypothetical protein